jgi:hypothetical protein
MSTEHLEGLHLPGQVKLHHIGFVLTSIQGGAESFARSLGATWDGNIILDSLQKVRVTFLKGPYATDSLIELVEPGALESPVSRFLERGGGLHHLIVFNPLVACGLNRLRGIFDAPTYFDGDLRPPADFEYVTGPSPQGLISRCRHPRVG